MSKKKDSDLPETQPEGVDPRDTRIRELEDANAILADQALAAEAKAKTAGDELLGALLRYEEMKAAAAFTRSLELSVVTGDVHHLNPDDLTPVARAWISAKRFEVVMNTQEFLPPAGAEVMVFAGSRGAKDGDLLRFKAGQ